MDFAAIAVRVVRGRDGTVFVPFLFVEGRDTPFAERRGRGTRTAGAGYPPVGDRATAATGAGPGPFAGACMSPANARGRADPSNARPRDGRRGRERAAEPDRPQAEGDSSGKGSKRLASLPGRGARKNTISAGRQGE